MARNRGLIKAATLLGLVAATSSCVSPPGAYARVSKNDAVLLSKLGRIQSTCAEEASQGQFLSNLQAVNIPGLSFEGVWDTSMAHLSADLSLPMGEPLARIELRDGESESKLSFPGTLQTRDEIEALGGFLERVGARGMRLFFCGLHFVPEKGDSAFVPPENITGAVATNSRTFWVRRKLQILTSKIHVTSDVFVTKENNERVALSAQSHLRSGYLMPTEIGTLTWNGYVQNNQVTPVSVIISVGANSYELNFFEFE